MKKNKINKYVEIKMLLKIDSELRSEMLTFKFCMLKKKML